MKRITETLTRTSTLLKRRWKLLLVLAIVVGGLGWYVVEQQAAENVPQTFVSPQRTSITESLELSGTVDAKQKAQLRFALGGKITYLGAQEGDFVKKWQTIATIDQATLQKQLEQNLNLYLKERWDWEQTQDNIDNDYNGLELSERRVVDKEQFDLNNSVISVEIQDIAIKNTRLTAPFDGIVTVSPTTVTGVQLLGSDFFEVINPDSIIFRTTVEEEDVVKLMLGQQAAISLDAFKDETLQSTISYISYSAVQTQNGTVFVVEFPLSNPAEGIPFRIGMRGEANVVLAHKDDVLTIPAIATIQRDTATFVKLQVEDVSIIEKSIEVGLESEDLVEVVSGLSESDRVLLPE